MAYAPRGAKGLSKPVSPKILNRMLFLVLTAEDASIILKEKLSHDYSLPCIHRPRKVFYGTCSRSELVIRMVAQAE
nr:hypothetical protein BaRGS_018522 [Batillaria attramentaria]